jgi:septum formation protein
LLKLLWNDFKVIPSKAEELHDASIPALELCRINAGLKAQEIARAHRDCTVLGADTLVALHGIPYGKPRDLAEARAMLRALSGNTHEVITAICIADGGPDQIEIVEDQTHVVFKSLDDAVIDEYLRLVPVLDKAGAYGIQERGEMLAERIDGSFNNVMGLPTERLAPLLIQRGYNVRTR